MRYRWSIAGLLLTAVLHAVITAVNPLILKVVIDDGILARRPQVVVLLSACIVGLAVVDSAAAYAQTWLTSRVGQGLIYHLRTAVFTHIQRQPIAFFIRTRTGALVSRLSTDIIGAQEAVTTVLSETLSTVLTLVLVIAAMLYLSWQITVAALVLIPFFLVPGRIIAAKVRRLARERMQLNAEMTSLMSERFNASGAMLAKLYGRAEDESDGFACQAARVRDITVTSQLRARLLYIVITVLIGLTTAVVYGFGGALVVNGALQIGTLVAMITLLQRLFGPIGQLSTMQLTIMTALTSFERVFELLDLTPAISEQPGAYAMPRVVPEGGAAPDIRFESVCFRYPSAGEVSVPSLEAPGARDADRAGSQWTLRNVSFRVSAGRLTALVGPSGAGKSTLTYLVPRLYDPTSGVVRIGGRDIRTISFRSLHDAVGVVTQDAHLFHDTIRANLLYARPDASERDLVEACKAAQIWTTVASLPDGLDTMVGDRGYHLSGGEKQRLSLARLLLKEPPIVILDEATAHLDSESEVAVQRALKTALAGRTSLVIAHRLSTVREADEILVVDAGEIRERGTHDELLAASELYAELYRTQFARRHDDPTGAVPGLQA